MKKIFNIVILAVLALMLSGSSSNSSLSRPQLLLKVFKYTEWRLERAPTQPFTICIIGKSETEISKKLPIDAKINNKQVIPKKIKSIEEVGNAEVLYIAQSEYGKLNTILAHVQNYDILTVGESRGMAHRGVIVNIYEEYGEIKFEINDAAEKSSTVNLHAHLFRIADVIR